VNSELRRFVFTRGNYVAYHDDKIGRIDQIFLHEEDGVERIFAVLAKMELRGDRDELLDLPLVSAEGPIIVGLPAIQPKKLYFVDINDDDTVWVKWEVEWC
jgi:hypothetical protein